MISNSCTVGAIETSRMALIPIDTIPAIEHLKETVKFLVASWVSVLPTPLQLSILSIRWSPTLAGMFKLNFDGSVMGNPGRAGIGGVIRNCDAKIISSFLGYVGNCSVNKA